MPQAFPAQMKVTPSFNEPKLVVAFAQKSGAFEALAGGAPKTSISSEDLFVYVNSLTLRSEVLASQNAPTDLPSATLIAEYFSTPTYLLRTRAIYDHHDIAAGANYSVAVPQAQKLAMRQGINQFRRSMLLYGLNSAGGEGLLNTSGATAVTLPADQYGNTTFSTYDSGDMALFFLQQIVSLKSRMFQSGGNIKNRIVVISPQRVFLDLEQAAIVQVTSYQRPGAGTATVGQVIADVSEGVGTEFDFYYDDTLIGKGSGGTDMVIMTIPEFENTDGDGINTNIFFQDITPKMLDVNLMYADAPAPFETPTPIADGGVTEMQEIRSSCGWCIRPFGLSLISIPYN